MNSNSIFDEVIGLLLDVKRGLQRMKNTGCSELISKVDTCITRIAPLNDVWNSRANSSPLSRTPQLDGTSIHLERNSMIQQYRPREVSSEIESPTHMSTQ